MEMTVADQSFAGNLRFRRLWVVVGWLLILLVVYLSLTPAPIDLDFKQGDKFSHALAYLVLMSWFMNLYENLTQRLGYALGFIVLAVGLEILQQWTGYRSFEVADMMASATGIALGAILSPPRIPNFLLIAERFWRMCRARDK